MGSRFEKMLESFAASGSIGKNIAFLSRYVQRRCLLEGRGRREGNILKAGFSETLLSLTNLHLI